MTAYCCNSFSLFWCYMVYFKSKIKVFKPCSIDGAVSRSYVFDIDPRFMLNSSSSSSVLLNRMTYRKI